MAFDPRSAEVVAARALGVMLVESQLRARTQPVLLAAFVVAVLGIVAALLLGGLLGVLIGLLSFVLLMVTAVASAVRSVTLAGVRRVAGGADYNIAKPILERHMAELNSHRDNLPLGKLGLLRLLSMTRRPAVLQAHVREAGEAVSKSVPGLLTELSTALSSRGVT